MANLVFRSPPPPQTETAGAFLAWLNSGKGRLVSAGKLSEELFATRARQWLAQAAISGQLIQPDDRQVKERTHALEREGECRSNDPHVIALAQVSGARLLYSNDAALQQDFKNHRLLRQPRGKVISTLQETALTPDQQKLLNNRNLCRPRS